MSNIRRQPHLVSMDLSNSVKDELSISGITNQNKRIKISTIIAPQDGVLQRGGARRAGRRSAPQSSVLRCRTRRGELNGACMSATSAAVAQHSFLITHCRSAAYLDVNGVGLGRVGVEVCSSSWDAPAFTARAETLSGAARRLGATGRERVQRRTAATVHVEAGLAATPRRRSERRRGGCVPTETVAPAAGSPGTAVAGPCRALGGTAEVQFTPRQRPRTSARPGAPDVPLTTAAAVIPAR